MPLSLILGFHWIMFTSGDWSSITGSGSSSTIFPGSMPRQQSSPSVLLDRIVSRKNGSGDVTPCPPKSRSSDNCTTSCGPYYVDGDQCRQLNMTSVQNIISGGMIILYWDLPPLLNGRAIVYQKFEDNRLNGRIESNPIKMGSTSRSLRVENLNSDGSVYMVCIESRPTADQAVLVQSLDNLTNCLHLKTSLDYDSMFGWLLAVGLAGLTVLLIYIQRDKIELLYFGRPLTGYYRRLGMDVAVGERTNSCGTLKPNKSEHSIPCSIKRPSSVIGCE